jgi:hypothetical protein
MVGLLAMENYLFSRIFSFNSILNHHRNTTIKGSWRKILNTMAGPGYKLIVHFMRHAEVMLILRRIHHFQMLPLRENHRVLTLLRFSIK